MRALPPRLPIRSAPRVGALGNTLGLRPIIPPEWPDLPPAFEVDVYLPPQGRADLLMKYVWQGAGDEDVGRATYGVLERAVREGRVTPGDPAGYVQALVDWQGPIVYANDPYYPDGWQMDVYQSASFTIGRGAKDCEDGAILLAAQCWWAGIYAEPWFLAQQNASSTHVAVGVCLPASVLGRLPPAGRYPVEVVRPQWRMACTGEMRWVETILPEVSLPSGRVVLGARVGEHPYDALARQQREVQLDGRGMVPPSGYVALCGARDGMCPPRKPPPVSNWARRAAAST